MKKYFNFLRNVVLITSLILISFHLGGQLSGRVVVNAASPYENLKTFADALSKVQMNYVEEVNSKDLIYGAIRGMLSSLDPHSSFMTPDDFKEMKVETKGSFGGVGIEITMKDNLLTVVAPIEDTPAFEAGIQAKDIITKIDGEITKDMTIMQAVKKMRGKVGTEVILTIFREGEKDLIDIRIIRAVIKIKSVKYKALKGGYAYARVASFQERTTKDLKKVLDRIASEEGAIKGLVLDLRGNPGGLLDQAVGVSDLFLSSGLIVYTDGRLESQKMKFSAHSNGTEPGYPIVVLVDAGSASASEIVAGALQDTGRGVILGTKTFGKGSVQTILPLEDGSGVRITTARYYTPSGRSIQAEGITPDLIVERALTPKAKKHAVFREKDLKGHMLNGNGKEDEEEENKETEEEPEETVIAPIPPLDRIEEDNQVKSALDVLKSWEIFKKGQSATS